MKIIKGHKWEPAATAPDGVFVTVVDDLRYTGAPFSRYSAIKDGADWKNVHGQSVSPSHWLDRVIQGENQ
jgi:hypothetical protein